jgi:hypothetical protein
VGLKYFSFDFLSFRLNVGELLDYFISSVHAKLYAGGGSLSRRMGGKLKVGVVKSEGRVGLTFILP